MGENRLSPRGEFDDLKPDLSPEQRKLAEAVRDLVRQTGRGFQKLTKDIEEKRKKQLNKDGPDGYLTAGTDRYLIKDAYLSKSVLWDVANGNRKRPPREAPLRALHEFALDIAETEDAVIPWDELNGLRRAFSPLRKQPPSVLSCPDCGAVIPVEQAIAPDKPAEIATTVMTDVAPVPRGKGDRHNSGAVDIAWPTARNLASYISVGNFERANGLIRHVGTEAIPAETANAVVSCRKLGLHEATDTIISYAARRSDGDVLRIVRSLNQQDSRVDADALLERALAD
ncbi:hypothetical protein [Nocardia amikacinitolerans]|uniref:hypothetical protein n=1 Tax=Nocardia amikacinitolerans TaxID=756689 RepID=UPI0020A25DB3|nr:hypothetical protein [Nocardia amikacinitolerans]MCP2287378.1 hypothetical protein [Nocardia amikacinitolerans]